MSVHFSSDRHDWATPPALFLELSAKYGPFTLDVCATKHNTKCARFFNPEIDGLTQPWSGCCWMNPPYGRAIGKWMEKAVDEVFQQARAERVVALLPARTDTAWWHDYVMPFVPFDRITFLRGRVRFVGATSGAPFPSVVVSFERGGVHT